MCLHKFTGPGGSCFHPEQGHLNLSTKVLLTNLPSGEGHVDIRLWPARIRFRTRFDFDLGSEDVS